MLELLPTYRYADLYNVEPIHRFPIISSVIYAKQDGHVFVDNADNPQIVFVIHKCTFSYLHTTIDIDYSSLLLFFHSCSIIPQYFHVYDAPILMVEAQKRVNRFNARLRGRQRMSRMEAVYLDDRTHGFRIKGITGADTADMQALGINFLDKYWLTMSEFIRDGEGCIIYDGDKPVSMCYLVCVVNGNSEPDIVTLAEYRGKGLASLACNYLLQAVVKRQINMDWDVFEDNTPSIKVIEKFGYKTYMRYQFLSLYKNDI